jgi:hypothetical protein
MEIKRMQELAGIKNESSSNNITLYTSYYLENYEGPSNDPDYLKYRWKPEFKNGVTAEFGKGATGTTEGKPSILCLKTPFGMFDKDGETVPYVNVKFQKPLSEVYIDNDDFDIEEFGMEYGGEGEEWIDTHPKTSLQDLIPFGLDIKNKDLSFYGCYVLDIKSNEILNISKVE